MSTTTYRQFCVVVRVELDDASAHRYQVAGTISQLKDGTAAYAMITIKEFATEKAAYEFALQKAREWIEQHPQGAN